MLGDLPVYSAINSPEAQGKKRQVVDKQGEVPTVSVPTPACIDCEVKIKPVPMLTIET